MKKLENFGRNLSKAEQKKIIGGFGDGGGGGGVCSGEEVEYCCDLTWLDEHTSSENICASSIQNARVGIYNKHPNQLTAVDCSI